MPSSLQLTFNQQDGFRQEEVDAPSLDTITDDAGFEKARATAWGLTLNESWPSRFEGSNSGDYLAVYSRKGDFKFAVEMSDTCNWNFIFVRDEPNMIALVLKLTPMLHNPTFDLANINDKLDKLFRAYHGHSSEVACAECDPYAHAAHQKHALERQKQRDAKVTAASSSS